MIHAGLLHRQPQRLHGLQAAAKGGHPYQTLFLQLLGGQGGSAAEVANHRRGTILVISPALAGNSGRGICRLPGMQPSEACTTASERAFKRVRPSRWSATQSAVSSGRPA